MSEYKNPMEYGPLPPEHNIPEEYPISKPIAAAKKKGSAKRLIAMCLTGFVAIQLLFTYFVPPTDDKKEPSDPIWTEPSAGPGSSVTPGYDIGDFQVRPLASNVDDGVLTANLTEAAQSFQRFDFVRASLLLYYSMLQYKTGVSPYGMAQIGYTVLDGQITDFNANVANACHIYYQKEQIWFVNKIGEMESYEGLRGTMVLFSDAPGGTDYRVLTLRISMDDSYAMYGAYVSYNADYIEGVFDVEGNCDHCVKTSFAVSETTMEPNLDGYHASGVRRLTGSVSGGAFMNGTFMETDIVYNENGDFVENVYRPGRNVTFNELTADGCLDLNNAAVLNETTSYNENAWDTFEADPAIRYLAYSTHVIYKFDDSAETGELFEIDIDKPLLPLDLHTAFCIRQIVADAQGDVGDDEPNVDISLYSPGLIQASDYLMNNDYVGASIALTDTFIANYINGQGDMDLVYTDGSIQHFSGQDLTDGSGVYIRLIEQIVMVYNEKVDDYDPEMHLFATLIHAADQDTGETDTHIVTVEIPYYYLGQNSTYTYAEVEYLDASVDEDFHGSMELVTYYLYGSTETEGSNNRDGYEITGGYQVVSFLTGGDAGLETRYKDCGLFLSDDKTAVIPMGALKDHASILDLASNGVLVPVETLVDVDLTAMDPSSDEFFDARDAAIADSNVRYILYSDGNGGRILYVKNVIYVEGQSHRGLRIYEEEWEDVRFPLNDTLHIWISIYQQIRQ